MEALAGVAEQVWTVRHHLNNDRLLYNVKIGLQSDIFTSAASIELSRSQSTNPTSCEASDIAAMEYL